MNYISHSHNFDKSRQTYEYRIEKLNKYKNDVKYYYYLIVNCIDLVNYCSSAWEGGPYLYSLSPTSYSSWLHPPSFHIIQLFYYSFFLIIGFFFFLFHIFLLLLCSFRKWPIWAMLQKYNTIVTYSQMLSHISGTWIRIIQSTVLLCHAYCIFLFWLW